MTSRERVLCAVSHRQPDRVPIDLGATPSSGISAAAHHRYMAYLNIREKTRVYDVVQQVAEPGEALLCHCGADVHDLERMFTLEEGYWQDAALPDGTPVQWPASFRTRPAPDGGRLALLADGRAAGRMPAGSNFFDQTIFPFEDGYPQDYSSLPKAMGEVVWGAFAHSPWDAAREGFYLRLRQAALKLRAQSDRAIMLVCGCNLFEWGTFLRRIDQFLMDLIECPGEVERLLDALMEVHMSTLAQVCQAVGDVVDIIRFGDDLGMESGPFMSPSMYRALFKPRHAQLCAYVKKHSGMKTFLHSCGSIYKLLPDLIEAGYDILNPVQTACTDMEPKRLKREFGRDITFWGGGVDTRSILNHGTKEQVRENVLENLSVFAPGGGYVFGAIHNILPDVPPQNIEAMFQAVREFEGR